MNVTLAKIVSAVELTNGQKAAIAKLFGPEYKEGSIYRRTEPDGSTQGDLYIASKKLGEGENMAGGYDMFNLTRKDRNHVLAKFDPAKFVLVAADARSAGLRG